MKKFFQDFVILSATVVFLSSVAIYISSQKTPVERQPEGRQTYKDEAGNLKYAIGTCEKDTGCFVAGCSSQLCSDRKDVITTCEIREDFPNKEIYSCGCVQGFCAWYRE